MSEFEQFKANLLKKYIREERDKMGWAEAQEPLTITYADDYTPAELEAVLALQRQWVKLGKRGVEEGWLVWTGGYADGEYKPERRQDLKHPTRTVSRPESKFEKHERLRELVERIKESAQRRLDAELNTEKSTNNHRTGWTF